MPNCTGTYYIKGNDFYRVGALSEAVFRQGICFYEVLRVLEGTCLFLPDHLARLRKSATLAGYSFHPDESSVPYMLRELIQRNNLHEGNIRLIYQVHKPDAGILLACCTPFAYPTPAQYQNGVTVATQIWERPSPQIKQVRTDYHREVQSLIEKKSVYEILLVDKQHRITEGSKSNVFFIRQNTLFTAPGESVLNGITRIKIIDICKELNYKLIEEFISIKNIHEVEAVFLTGTSPKVLPVNRVDERSFPVDHPLMRSLMAAYDTAVTAYLSAQVR